MNRLRAGVAVAIVVLFATMFGLTSQSFGLADINSHCDSTGRCDFGWDWTLDPFNDSQQRDRATYNGYFHSDLVSVENLHPSGTVPMCAGVKTGPAGGGNDVGPLGMRCTQSTDYLNTVGRQCQSGYATIINYDIVTHYDFYAHAWKC